MAAAVVPVDGAVAVAGADDDGAVAVSGNGAIVPRRVRERVL